MTDFHTHLPTPEESDDDQRSPKRIRLAEEGSRAEDRQEGPSSSRVGVSSQDPYWLFSEPPSSQFDEILRMEDTYEPEISPTTFKGKGKARESTPEKTPEPIAGPSTIPASPDYITISDDDDDDILLLDPTPKQPVVLRSPTPPDPDAPSEFNCPICFCQPTAAVLTPCGHIMCGACLFSAIESAQARARNMGYGANHESMEPRCPVCRAVLKNWDGRGRGVLGLEIKFT